MFTDIIVEFEKKKEVSDHRNLRLLLKMKDRYSKIIKSEDVNVYMKLLACTDFVSRMTDGYAMKLYKKLKGIEI